MHQLIKTTKHKGLQFENGKTKNPQKHGAVQTQYLYAQTFFEDSDGENI